MDFCSSTLTSKGQTTIPAEVRKMLGLKANMKIFWISLRPGEVSLVPAPDQKGEGGWTKKLCGIMADQSVDGINWLMQEKKKDQSLEKRGIIG